jgi:Family of unknown function (DUF5985)
MTIDVTAMVMLQSISATAAGAAGTFFFRFWRETADRLFLYFALAFWLMAGSWLGLAALDPTAESRPYVYAVRLLAFVLIIVAMFDKSRTR